MSAPMPPLPPRGGRRPVSGPRRLARLFDHAAIAATRLAGTPYAFSVALLVVAAWALSGPYFGFSETWQLVINTGTTIITFLMVFVIQHSQNRDSIALHLKLNELLSAVREASNGMIAVEELDEGELQLVRQFYHRLAQLDRQAGGVTHSHSSERIAHAHARKRGRHGAAPAPGPEEPAPAGRASGRRAKAAAPARR